MPLTLKASTSSRNSKFCNELQGTTSKQEHHDFTEHDKTCWNTTSRFLDDNEVDTCYNVDEVEVNNY